MLEDSQIEDPFLKLFWEEQKKAASRDSRGMRWHPMMIRQVKVPFKPQSWTPIEDPLMALLWKTEKALRY